MGLYVDSGDPDAILRLTRDWGAFEGVTTNPALLRRAGLDELAFCRALSRAGFTGRLFLQVRTGTPEQMRAHVARLLDAWPVHALKIPFCPEGLRLVRDLRAGPGPRLCVTAVANVAQAAHALAAGADWVATYVGRIEEARGEGLASVRALADLCRSRGARCRVLAASIRRADWLTELLPLPLVDLTLPPDLITRAFADPVTEAALAEFRALAEEDA